MQIIEHSEIVERLEWLNLIDQMGIELRANRVVSPARQNLEIGTHDGNTANLLIMPAWISGECIGVKLVTFFPGNGKRGLPTINASYVLFNGRNGEVQSILNGDALTERRTAAASALAARYLARKDAARLLIVGTGQLSRSLAQAHAMVRTYSEIAVFGRNTERARSVAAQLRDDGLPAVQSDDLELSCERADVISSATSATQPILRGQWVQPGTHIDLIGSFKEDMRESDDELISKSQIYVDTRAGASRAGDISIPLSRGLIQPTDIVADLFELASGADPGRQSDQSITLFKSAGFSLEDLVAAKLAVTNPIERASL